MNMTFRTALAALLLLPLTAGAQTLEIATDQSPVGLDPQVATAFSTALIDSTIYEGLTASTRTCASFRRWRSPGRCRRTA